MSGSFINLLPRDRKSGYHGHWDLNCELNSHYPFSESIPLTVEILELEILTTNWNLTDILVLKGNCAIWTMNCYCCGFSSPIPSTGHTSTEQKNQDTEVLDFCVWHWKEWKVIIDILLSRFVLKENERRPSTLSNQFEFQAILLGAEFMSNLWKQVKWKHCCIVVYLLGQVCNNPNKLHPNIRWNETPWIYVKVEWGSKSTHRFVDKSLKRFKYRKCFSLLLQWRYETLLLSTIWMLEPVKAVDPVHPNTLKWLTSSL